MGRNLILLIIFSFLGIVVSGILIEHHVHPETSSKLLQSVCEIGGKSGCDVINQSEASTVLGMPIAFWGFLFYSFVFCFALFYGRHKKIFFIRLIFWFSIFGFLVDFTLFLYSILIVDAICSLCVISYICTIGMLIISGFILKRTSKGESLMKFDFDFIWLSQQPVTVTILCFSLIFSIFVGSFVFLYAKSSSNIGLSSQNHDVLLEEAWKAFQREYESIPVQIIPIEHSPYKGAIDPVLTIVEFADFLCPHCKIAGDSLGEIIKKYPKSIKVVFKNYPLDQACNDNIKQKFHEGSCKIAYLGLCSSRQKVSSFWKIHDRIFANHTKWIQLNPIQNSSFTNIISSIGVNPTLALSCLKQEKTKKDTIKDIKLGDSLGLSSTPTLFFNGKKMRGGIPNDYFFKKLLTYEIQKQIGEN